MKRTRNRSILLLILTVTFFIGLIYFAVNLIIHQEEWASKPMNQYVSGSGGLDRAGTIYDRNGIVVASSSNGTRNYSNNVNIRKAILHTVGDSTNNIATSVQVFYRKQLIGFNALTGYSNNSHDITLTLDSEVCRKVTTIVYNYKTGEIVCLVSTPSYDPENIPSDLLTNAKYDGAYINRAISSTYAPGSIFKIVTAAAAIDTIPNVMDRTFTCNGSKLINGELITCMLEHGEIDMKTAMAKSCNIAFAELAVEVGKDIMTETANKMGINTKYYINDIPTKSGNYNVSNADDNALAWSGIGQYTDLVNPISMLIICGAIANNGTPVKPYIISEISDGNILTNDKTKTEYYNQMISPSTNSVIADMLDYTMLSHYGKDMFEGMDICAKTGTAEVGGGKQPNAWMVGYSKDEDFPYAFVVVVEEGGYGISSAGPIAVTAMKALLP